MKYFIDTEYAFGTLLGMSGIITPISIGIVAEDGREFYRVHVTPVRDALAIGNLPPFVRAHVLPVIEMPGNDGLIGSDYVMPLAAIADDLRFFIGNDTPEWWGDWADFDYVVLSIIMGGFDAWPEGWPMFIHDLQQTPEGREASGSVQSAIPHNALADARAVRNAFELAVLGRC
jgi:hypothetical protein